MLFTARSPAFSVLQTSAGVTSLARTRGLPAHLPWLVVSFLRCDYLSSCWETVCAAREDDLLDHLKRSGVIQIAQFLYMAPPIGAGQTWARYEIHRVERVTSPEGEFSVYVDNRQRKFCFANPDFDFESAAVSRRRTLVRVDRYVHFN